MEQKKQRRITDVKVPRERKRECACERQREKERKTLPLRRTGRCNHASFSSQML